MNALRTLGSELFAISQETSILKAKRLRELREALAGATTLYNKDHVAPGWQTAHCTLAPGNPQPGCCRVNESWQGLEVPARVPPPMPLLRPDGSSSCYLSRSPSLFLPPTRTTIDLPSGGHRLQLSTLPGLSPPKRLLLTCSAESPGPLRGAIPGDSQSLPVVSRASALVSWH